MIWLLGLLTATTAFAQAPLNHADYAKAFPFHIKFAAMTQIKPKNKTPGGPGGHAYVYVHGLCKDYSKSFPAVIPCSKAKFPPGMEHEGVGISIDNDFVNSAFVVIPGHDLFFKGVKVEGLLDETEREALIAEAKRLKIFDGIKVKETLVSPDLPADQYLHDVIENGVGTDIAGAFGRDALVIGFRTDEAAMQPIADYVNGFNEPFVTGKEIYVWSGFHDNCAMLSANILQSACVRHGIPVRQPWFQQIFNIALPRNGLSTLQTQLHYGGRNVVRQWLNPGKSGIEFETIRRNDLWWSLLKEGRTLPVGLGAISEDYQSYQGDDLYEDNIRVARMPHKILGANQLSDHVLDHLEFTDLRENLIYWGKAIEKAYDESRAKKQTADRILYQKWLEREMHVRLGVIRTLDLKGCNEILLDQ